METNRPSNDGMKSGLLLLVMGLGVIGIGVFLAQWLLNRLM